VSFDVDRPGVPVLVKVSYFPNWRAHGARGPWRATPNEMVVVPTRRHVTLAYEKTAIDDAGLLVTAAAVLGLIVLWRLGPVAMPEPPVAPVDDRRREQARRRPSRSLKKQPPARRPRARSR
jgi:hypothetical protein